MDFASICVPANKLGSGCYSTAYKVPGDPTAVVLLCNIDNDPCRYDFLQWCMERLRKFGLMSMEMSMLPEVYFVGKHAGLRVAVMRRYHRANRSARGSAFHPGAAKIERQFVNLYGGLFSCSDCHGGNQWWCPSRKAWIVSDPIAECTGPGAFTVATETLPGAFNVRSLKRNKAQWKERRFC